MKIVIVTNIPAPYRLPIFEKIAKKLGDNFLVIFAARTEPNRSWNIGKLNFKHLFLNENITEKSDGFNYVHNNPDIWKHLKKFNPDVIITTGFNPTHLYAWMYAKLFAKKHIPMTDGTLESEKHLSPLHKIIRKLVYATSHAFIGASTSSLKLFRNYNIPKESIFQSHLCINNEHFQNTLKFDDRPYDLMFSGQLTERKLPFLFADIAKKVSDQIKGIKVLILGDGPLKKDLLERLKNDNIDYEYAGFVEQKMLPLYYSQAKLFLFTTRLDPWGVVANEALASGTPVIVTPHAGVADDLVQNSFNGYVLEAESDVWAKYSVEILQDSAKWQILSENARKSVDQYTFENAANGILNACEYTFGI
ncbi:MAG: glycosyltransferase family 4 protein [Sulfuricurvum sp.]|nr:glycosyltransferase family 4 protein [Sulfuricurvum sp.]